MDRMEFAKKIIELVAKDKDKMYDIINGGKYASGYMTAFNILQGNYTTAKNYAVAFVVYDAIHSAISLDKGVAELEAELKRIEELHRVKPPYDEIYKEIKERFEKL